VTKSRVSREVRPTKSWAMPNRWASIIPALDAFFIAVENASTIAQQNSFCKSFKIGATTIFLWLLNNYIFIKLNCMHDLITIRLDWPQWDSAYLKNHSAGWRGDAIERFGVSSWKAWINKRFKHNCCIILLCFRSLAIAVFTSTTIFYLIPPASFGKPDDKTLYFRIPHQVCTSEDMQRIRMTLVKTVFDIIAS
jgi:hypothetical protein